AADNQLYIWEFHQQKLIAVLPCEDRQGEDTKQSEENLAALPKIHYLTLSPDEQTLVGAGYIFDPGIYVWDLGTNRLSRTLDVAYSFEALSGRLKRSLYIDWVEFAGNKHLLVKVGVDRYRETQIWNTETGELEDILALYIGSEEPSSKNQVWIPDLE